jgi:CRISPR system Cascade subunit CasE
MIASMLRLTRSDIKALRITDAYSLHRIVYDLYEDVRTEAEKSKSVPSGILYADKGGDWNTRSILLLSNRLPRTPSYGELKSKPIPADFLKHQDYTFEIFINPTKRDKKSGKTVAITNRDEVMQWFITKAPKSWGFNVKPGCLLVQSIGLKTFKKEEHTVTLGSALLKGQLEVVDYDRFSQSFMQGIGRGRAFGFGLLQIVPIINPFKI